MVPQVDQTFSNGYGSGFASISMRAIVVEPLRISFKVLVIDFVTVDITLVPVVSVVTSFATNSTISTLESHVDLAI